MDGRMPPRVTYWTGLWDPQREALSKEVDALRRALAPRAPVISFSPGQSSSLTARNRVVRLSGDRAVLLRMLAMMLERQGHVTHIFGSIAAWHFLRYLGRRPLIFTVALPGLPLDHHLYSKVSVFAAESQTLASALLAAGIPGNRVHVISPGVDLNFYTSTPAPAGRFRLLFASSPASPTEFEARGIPLMIELARRCPDVELVFLWRQWIGANAMRRAFEGLQPPPNVTSEWRDATDMRTIYQGVHATMCCFSRDFGKSCPQSVIESLASGRPVLVTDTCGIGDLIRAHGAGAVTSRDVESLERGVQTLRTHYARLALHARTLAETHFNLSVFCEKYAALYEEIASDRAAGIEWCRAN
jgi:glycosyltransferase involved in cell wall biosynthesis